MWQSDKFSMSPKITHQPSKCWQIYEFSDIPQDGTEHTSTDPGFIKKRYVSTLDTLFEFTIWYKHTLREQDVPRIFEQKMIAEGNLVDDIFRFEQVKS